MGNLLVDNHQYGMAISNVGTDNNLISYNTITGSNLGGVLISGGADNVIGPENYIFENGADGVWIVGSDAIRNLVTQNSIGDNTNSGIDLEAGANGGILPPVITSDEHAVVSGTACAGCTVELFISDETDDEGWAFLGSTTANGSGAFSMLLNWLPVHYSPSIVFTNLTATASLASQGTSEFSSVFETDLSLIYLPLMVR
jgi:hypothetical protein